MSELGQMLREARESKGVSLAEAEEATKIRRKHLQALEEADYSTLPPSVYVRGFLRSYATYLGLDPEEALAAYHDGLPKDRVPQEPHIISEPLTPSSQINWELIGTVLMLIAVGVLLVFVYRRYVVPLATNATGQPPTATQAPALPSTDTPEAMVADVPAATPTTTPTPPTPTSVPPTPTATRIRRPTATPTLRSVRAQGLTLKLTATGRSWIRVALDGQTAFEGILASGDEQTWKARRQIELRTGNAGGLIGSINDQDLGTLGDPGDVLDYLWQLSNTGQVILATPTP